MQYNARKKDSTRLSFWISFYRSIVHAAALLPASAPVENAICRLNPPVCASTSSTSPAKNSPGVFLLIIVPGVISSTSTPPRVTMASSIGLVPTT